MCSLAKGSLPALYSSRSCRPNLDGQVRLCLTSCRYMQAALDHLRATGYSVLESDLEHLSPSSPVTSICMGRTISTCRLPRSGRGNCARCGRQNPSSDTCLSVVNFVGGPNRP